MIIVRLLKLKFQKHLVSVVKEIWKTFWKKSRICSNNKKKAGLIPAYFITETIAGCVVTPIAVGAAPFPISTILLIFIYLTYSPLHPYSFNSQSPSFYLTLYIIYATPVLYKRTYASHHIFLPMLLYPISQLFQRIHRCPRTFKHNLHRLNLMAAST